MLNNCLKLELSLKLLRIIFRKDDIYTILLIKKLFIFVT